jgi:hypothetical protein
MGHGSGRLGYRKSEKLIVDGSGVITFNLFAVGAVLAGAFAFAVSTTTLTFLLTITVFHLAVTVVGAPATVTVAAVVVALASVILAGRCVTTTAW